MASELKSDLLESLVGYALRRATGSVMTDFVATMEDIAVRPVLFALLATISENPGVNQTMLGQSLGIQRANLVPLVNELKGRGLIERRPAPNDRRAFALHLSKAGQGLLDEAVRRVRVHEERILSGLSAEERRTLLDLLARIRGRSAAA